MMYATSVWFDLVWFNFQTIKIETESTIFVWFVSHVLFKISEEFEDVVPLLLEIAVG